MTEPSRPSPEDTLDLVARLRHVADTLPSVDDVRLHVTAIGGKLGLPESWLATLPEIGLLPGEYPTGDHYGEDASLTWAAQEHLARTGRLAECDPMLVAEALEGEGADDGRSWLHKAVKKTLFLLAWPTRTYAAHVRLQVDAESIIDCLHASPSALLFPVVASAWRSARHDILMLAPDLELAEECPWPDLAAVLRAAADCIDVGREMERKRCRGELLPDENGDFMR